MPNARATRGLILLDNHLATGTESTYTFTKTLDMKNTYREIKIIINGKSTAALELQLKINAATNYNVQYINAEATTLATANLDAEATHPLIPIGTLDGANTFFSEIHISFNDAVDGMAAIATSYSMGNGIHITAQDVQTTATTITSIQLLVSTSTWIAGTEMSIYGLKR